MRRTLKVTPAGRVADVRARLASVRCSARSMSVFQAKLTLMSAEPRLVVERRLRTPGTALIASSIGRVMVASVWSIGRSPASIDTAMRGNGTAGNRPTGRLSPANRPPRMASASSASSDRRWRAMNSEKFMVWRSVPPSRLAADRRPARPPGRRPSAAPRERCHRRSPRPPSPPQFWPCRR